MILNPKRSNVSKLPGKDLHKLLDLVPIFLEHISVSPHFLVARPQEQTQAVQLLKRLIRNEPVGLYHHSIGVWCAVVRIILLECEPRFLPIEFSSKGLELLPSLYAASTALEVHALLRPLLDKFSSLHRKVLFEFCLFLAKSTEFPYPLSYFSCLLGPPLLGFPRTSRAGALPISQSCFFELIIYEVEALSLYWPKDEMALRSNSDLHVHFVQELTQEPMEATRMHTSDPVVGNSFDSFDFFSPGASVRTESVLLLEETKTQKHWHDWFTNPVSDGTDVGKAYREKDIKVLGLNFRKAAFDPQDKLLRSSLRSFLQWRGIKGEIVEQYFADRMLINISRSIEYAWTCLPPGWEKIEHLFKKYPNKLYKKLAAQPRKKHKDVDEFLETIFEILEVERKYFVLMNYIHKEFALPLFDKAENEFSLPKNFSVDDLNCIFGKEGNMLAEVIDLSWSLLSGLAPLEEEFKKSNSLEELYDNKVPSWTYGSRGRIGLLVDSFNKCFDDGHFEALKFYTKRYRSIQSLLKEKKKPQRNRRPSFINIRQSFSRMAGHNSRHHRIGASGIGIAEGPGLKHVPSKKTLEDTRLSRQTSIGKADDFFELWSEARLLLNQKVPKDVSQNLSNDLVSILARPFQRMSKYMVSVDHLLKSTNEEHPAYKDLKQLAQRIRNYNLEINQDIG
eukprot:augustus_masked-scaffold_5-processed-gene-9.40-mRNA-1 protein AED:1.00 eAED:1.00 QI:0/-1/0/0/-1/1/1/0/675